MPSFSEQLIVRGIKNKGVDVSFSHTRLMRGRVQGEMLMLTLTELDRELKAELRIFWPAPPHGSIKGDACTRMERILRTMKHAYQ